MPVQINMEMPRSCGDCRFCRTEVFGCVYCDAYENYGKEISPCTKLQLFAGRKDWCPLVETEEQKWHVVADGDLPKKIIDEYGIPVEYIVMIAGAEEPTTAVMDEDGEWYDVAFEYYNIPESEKDYFNVVAWRELPEPWEEKENTK